jgi:hypothetical protein
MLPQVFGRLFISIRKLVDPARDCFASHDSKPGEYRQQNEKFDAYVYLIKPRRQ